MAGGHVVGLKPKENGQAGAGSERLVSLDRPYYVDGENAVSGY